MRMDDLGKLLFAILLLSAYIGWGVFSVLVVRSVWSDPTREGILAVAGVAGMSGVLGTLATLPVQYYFRKAKP